jgi:anti-sigma B factor antagonist
LTQIHRFYLLRGRMQLEHRQLGDHVVVTLMDNRLDAAIADDFKSAMLGYLEAGQRHLVLDLAEIDFIDSSGIGAIVKILKSVGPDGSLRLCRLQESVFSIFRLTRMTQVFSIHDSPEAAVAA